jgi:sodium transport system permease protein
MPTDPSRRVGSLLRDAAIVFVNEIRIQFRDGHVLLSALLLPLLLYPLVFWATGEFITVGTGSLEKTASRIGVPSSAVAHPLVARLGREAEARVLPVAGGASAVISGRVDAFLDLPPGGALDAPVTLFYDASRPRSVRARERLDIWLEAARRDALNEAFAERGETSGRTVVFGRETENVATPSEMGGFLLGMLLPLTMVGMTTMGAFYPAIDVLVGERERNTLETLLASGAGRAAIVAGKYLTVVAAAVVAGTLNLGSMLLTALQFLRSFDEMPEQGYALPPMAVPTLLLGSLLLGAFFGAAMILLASMARTF